MRDNGTTNVALLCGIRGLEARATGASISIDMANAETIKSLQVNKFSCVGGRARKVFGLRKSGVRSMTGICQPYQTNIDYQYGTLRSHIKITNPWYRDLEINAPELRWSSGELWCRPPAVAIVIWLCSTPSLLYPFALSHDHGIPSQ